MLIREKKQEMDRAKEVKVKIPLSYHVKLHSMKVLTGKQISDTVTEALEAYFRHQQTARGAMPELTLDSVHGPSAGRDLDRVPTF